MNDQVEVNTKVQVHAMGCWYDAYVTACGPKRAEVCYTSGRGVVRYKSVPYELLRPAGTFEPMKKMPAPTKGGE